MCDDGHPIDGPDPVLTIDEFLNQFTGNEKIRFGKGTPNPETREGIYVSRLSGLSSRIFFVGLDKTIGRFIIEQIQ